MDKNYNRMKTARKLLSEGCSVEEAVKKMKKMGDTKYSYQPQNQVMRLYKEEFQKGSKKKVKPEKKKDKPKVEKTNGKVNKKKTEKVESKKAETKSTESDIDSSATDADIDDDF